MSSVYRKFSSRFASNGGKSKTFASFATFAEGGQNFESQSDTDKATPKIQSAPAKVAQVAKVGTPEPVCAVCNAAGDLWRHGDILVHQECASRLPKPEHAEPSAAYEAVP